MTRKKPRFRKTRALVLGGVAGIAGTTAMDLTAYTFYRRGGGDQALLTWESAAGTHGWDTAPAPAQVGRLAVKAVTGEDPPNSWARSATNLVHWLTGIGWAAQLGLVNEFAKGPSLRRSLLFGPTVWLSSYVILPPLKVYKPMWSYDLPTLGRDLRLHLAYGFGTAAALAVLQSGRRR